MEEFNDVHNHFLFIYSRHLLIRPMHEALKKQMESELNSRRTHVESENEDFSEIQEILKDAPKTYTVTGASCDGGTLKLKIGTSYDRLLMLIQRLG